MATVVFLSLVIRSWMSADAGSFVRAGRFDPPACAFGCTLTVCRSKKTVAPPPRLNLPDANNVNKLFYILYEGF